MNDNLEVLNNSERGDFILIKYNEEISKIATYYRKENDRYCFKDSDGAFEFTEKYISCHLELIKIDED